MKIKRFFILTLVVGLSLIIISCDNEDEYEDVEVAIIDIYTSSANNRSVHVKYTVENVGNKKINGWDVYFSVRFEIGPKYEFSHNLSHLLAPSDISSDQIAQSTVPQIYGYSAEPTGAVVKRIVVY